MLDHHDYTVWVPTLENNVENLLDKGSEDFLRYSITSGELQRCLAGIIKRVQYVEIDGLAYGEMPEHSNEMQHYLREIAALFNRLEKEARVVSSYHP